MSKKKYKSGGSWGSSWFDFDSWGSSWSKTSYKPKKRKEIVKPYMSWWDHSKLNRNIRDENKEYVNGMQNFLKGTKDDLEKLRLAQSMFKDVISEDLIHDIYSIYYNKSSDLIFDKENDSNKVKFKILEKVNNSLLKIVSNDNSIASFMYTREICNFLFTEFWNNLTEQEKKDLQQAMKDMNSQESDEESDEDGEESEDGEGKGKGKGKKQKGKKGKGGGGESDEDSDDEEGDEDGEGGDSEDGEEDGEGQDGDDDEGEDSNGKPTNDSQQKGGKGNGNSKSSSNPSSKKKDSNGHNVKENVDKSKVDDWKKQNEEKQAEKRRKEREEAANRPQTANDKVAKAIEAMFNRGDVQKRFDEAITKADQTMINMEKAGIKLDKNDLNSMQEILNINNIKDDIAKLAINKGAIAEAIKNILDKSVNYFSKKYQVKEIDFFEADEIYDIFGVEYIHPVFRSGMLDRLSTEERKPLGRIDLYIDVSGSMSSGSGIPGVSNLMFAKSIALAMLNMDMLNNLYVFDTSVRQVQATEVGILTIGCGGGTHIDCVTQHVMNKARNNGICLTDGECTVNLYDERMFLLGTVGVVFNYFYTSEAGKQFLQAGQCINFDGKNVSKIEWNDKTAAQYKGRGW